ncbi:SpaH/EbpB family LPXTG-anchored major pilin [Leucobacter luti]|uniref:SpaH/EbpB family LPXTG-anchored major pilin n=1 Tax=Leucobacter luti TaxID=340320 RepID=UPI003CFC481F
MIRNERRGPGRRALAALAATALALFGAGSFASTANAAEPTPVVGNIEGTSGTLTIHKHAGNAGTAGDGTQIADTSALGATLAGVEFSVQRVSFAGTPIDLTTSAGWDQAAGATPALGGDYTGVPIAGSPFTTDANGQIAIPSLPFGLYLVTETAPGPNNIAAAAQPFLVSVPYPNATTGEWIYDVHVYPKNQLKDEPTKTLDSNGAVKQGDTVKWTINAVVPRPAVGNVITAFTITDQLDPRLELTTTTVKRNGVTLTAGTDYVLDPPTTANNNTVTVTPTLADVAVGQTYTIELVTKVNGAGEIVNTALRNTNGVNTEVGPVQTNWGKITVVKTSAKNDATLAGAEFELYKADKTTLVYPAVATNANGEINFDAVWVGDGTDKTENYCLKETKAPAGYVLPTDPWTCVDVTSNAEGTAVSVSITNTQADGPELPLTGSTGTAMFLAGGLALILVAGGGALVARKRRAAAQL